MPRRLTAPLLLLALACQNDKPEAQVKAAFEKARAAVEASDAVGATAILHPQFSGPQEMDAATARLALLGMLRQMKLGVTVLSNDVALEGQDVVQEVTLLMTQKGGGVLPEDYGRKHYLLRWRKKEGAWRLYRMEEVR